MLTKPVDLTLEKGLFTTYDYNNFEERSTTFTLDLTPIVESLSLAHSNATYSSNNQGNGSSSTIQCTLSYEGDNSPFVLIFEDSKISERCEFSTFLNLELSHLLRQNIDDNDRDVFEIDQTEVELECIISSDVFFDALKDLKDLETEEIFMYFELNKERNKSNKTFAIISKSIMGNSLLSLPNEISILEKLKINCVEDFDLLSFKFSIFQMCFKAIKLSNKCKLQKDNNNLLKVNLLCFKNEIGSILPKNYSGTVINFKIFENIVDADDINQIKKFIDKSLNSNNNIINLIRRNNAAKNASNNENNNENNEVTQSIIPDSGIDVPIFL